MPMGFGWRGIQWPKQTRSYYQTTGIIPACLKLGAGETLSVYDVAMVESVPALRERQGFAERFFDSMRTAG